MVFFGYTYRINGVSARKTATKRHRKKAVAHTSNCLPRNNFLSIHRQEIRSSENKPQHTTRCEVAGLDCFSARLQEAARPRPAGCNPSYCIAPGTPRPRPAGGGTVLGQGGNEKMLGRETLVRILSAGTHYFSDGGPENPKNPNID